MRIFKYLIAVFTLICLMSNSAQAGTFKADARTKRIPAGVTFRIKFMQPVSTFSGGEGDYFSAMLLNEQASETGVILPAGSVVRGSIGQIKTAKRFSRGAILYLDFDHVVTPTGRQIPLDMAVSSYDKINWDGGLYKNLGYGEAVKENYNKAAEITKNATNYGKKAGESAKNIQYITTPICAVGGFFGGVGYFVGDSVLDVFRKGKEVQINEGDEMDVKLLNPIDVPVY